MQPHVPTLVRTQRHSGLGYENNDQYDELFIIFFLILEIILRGCFLAVHIPRTQYASMANVSSLGLLGHKCSVNFY